MSELAIEWATRTKGHKSASQKLVLMVLAKYHVDEGVTLWPSHKDLTEECEIPERTIQRHMTNLETQGFIKTERKGNQYWKSEYKLNLNVFEAKVNTPYPTVNTPPGGGESKSAFSSPRHIEQVNTPPV